MNIEQATHDEEYGTAHCLHAIHTYIESNNVMVQISRCTGVLVVRSNLQTDSLLAVDYLLYFVFCHS